VRTPHANDAAELAPAAAHHPSTARQVRNGAAALEREVAQQGRYAYNATGHALYSAAAGALWGDHAEPQTRRGSIALLGYGFVVLVLVAAYTANLATFMSRRNISVLPINSMEDLTGTFPPATCVTSDFHNVYPAFDRLHPGLNYKASSDPVSALGTAHSCDAYLTYMLIEELASPSACWLNTIGTAVFRSEAGWVTPFRSECIATPLELALLDIQQSGDMKILLTRHLPTPESCAGPSTKAARRRRLDPNSVSIQSAGSGNLQNVGTSSSCSPSLPAPALSWEDLSGLFFLYFILLVVLAVHKVIEDCGITGRRRCRRRSTTWRISGRTSENFNVGNDQDCAN